MKSRRVVLTLSAEEYAALEAQAERELRDPWAQALLLLRQALAKQSEADRQPAGAGR